MCLLGCLLYNEDSNPALYLQKMYEPLKNLAHDDYAIKIERQTGFAQLLQNSKHTAESVNRIPPVFLEQEQILYSGQGRIDNRIQLTEQLGLRIDDQYPDSSLMLKAYLRWSKDCVHYLYGNWSFAVFDIREQELFISRDQMGYTSVYYYQDETGFYFSSSVKSLLALPNYHKQLNEEHFVRKLSLWGDDTLAAESTFYKNIYCLPIAHSLVVKDRVVASKKYWKPENIALRRYKNKQDYADEMLGIFTEAVKGRLQNDKPVASMLSGGLDSSAVSYIAADLLKKKGKRLTTLSHVPFYTAELQSDKQKEKKILDETPLIMEVVQASGNIQPCFLNSASYGILDGIKEYIDICDEPVHAASNVYWILDLYKTASQKGFGALLSGEGGNGTISFAGVDSLLPLTVSHFFSNPYQSVRKIAAPIKQFIFNQLNINSNLGKIMEGYVNDIFLKQSIIDQYNIIDDMRKNKPAPQYYSHIQEKKERFIELYTSRSLSGAACSRYFGIDLRDPTTDVRLVEYFFSVPNEAFFDENYNNRMLVKRMMKGKIPNTVLNEKRKGLQSSDIVYRARAQAQGITHAIDSIKISPVVNHYLDIKKLSKTWQLCLQQPYMEPYQMQRILKALNFALFLQMRFN